MIKGRLEARHFFFYAILSKTIAILETIVYTNAKIKKLKFSLNGLSRKGPTLGVFYYFFYKNEHVDKKSCIFCTTVLKYYTIEICVYRSKIMSEDNNEIHI